MTAAPAMPAPFSWVRLAEVGSTNDEARHLAETGRAGDLMAVTAVSQTNGRGRRGRVWVSPPGNLHLSLLVRHDGPPAAGAELGFAAAAALAAALSELVPAAEFFCKWPNDVMARPPGGGTVAKVAGMLLEHADGGWMIVGLGVDIAAAPPPEAVLQPAVALADLGYLGGTEPVLAAFCRHFGPLVVAWRAEGFAPVRAAWLERALGLGKTAVVRLASETLSGVFSALDADGALVLDQGPSGGGRRILAGDVFFPES